MYANDCPHAGGGFDAREFIQVLAHYFSFIVTIATNAIDVDVITIVDCPFTNYSHINQIIFRQEYVRDFKRLLNDAIIIAIVVAVIAIIAIIATTIINVINAAIMAAVTMATIIVIAFHFLPSISSL